MHKISVIIPVYNVEEYLRQCLDSIVSQTYNNLEIIIINDKSPDNSQKIIDEYAAKDSRIKPIFHKINKGLGGARNTGISVATGDYISFIDSDDYIALNTYEILSQEIEKNNSDIINFGRTDKYPNEEKIWKPAYNKQIYYSGWEDIKDATLKNKFNPICCTSIYKKNLIIDNNIVFPEKLLFEDFFFSFQTKTLAGKISYIDNPLYYWRKEREGSITYTVNSRDIEVCKSLQLVEDFLQKHNKTEILNSSEYHLLMYSWSAGTTIYKYLKTKGKKQQKQEIIQYLLNNKDFRTHLKKVAESNSVPVSMRFSAYLLNKNFLLFKIFYKMFLIITNK